MGILLAVLVLGQTNVVELDPPEQPRVQVIWQRSRVSVKTHKISDAITIATFEGWVLDAQADKEYSLVCKLNANFNRSMWCHTAGAGVIMWTGKKVLVGDSTEVNNEVIAPAMPSIAAQIRRGVK